MAARRASHTSKVGELGGDKNKMDKDTLLKLVLGSGDLPTLPTVASKLVSLTARDDTTLADVAELVSQDVGLSSKILRVSNSAFYNFPQQIGSIQQAISMLGTNAVQSLVLSFSFLGINKASSGDHFDFGKFWERSLSAAVASKLILERVPKADTEEILVSGLLQNLGELILACTVPGEYEKVLAGQEWHPGDPCAVEQSILGTDHCFIGSHVARHWNFPSSIYQPILHHHDPLAYSGDDKQIDLSTRAIYLSNLLLNIIHSEKPEEYHRRFRTEARTLLGLKSECIEQILDKAHLEFDEAAVHFGLQMAETRPIQRILQEANIRLSLLNLDYDQMNKQLVEAKASLENLMKELQEKNEILERLADIDGLTGVYNNRYFRNTFERELNRSVRNSKPLSLVLIDIDYFKKLNDAHGHLVGDFVLIEFSRILGSNLREYDTLARYGGEEFVVILPETVIEDACTVAEKLRSAIEAAVMREGSHEYRITASFGVSCAHPEEFGEISITELIKMADEALYDAKDSGRNQVAVYGAKKKWFKFKCKRTQLPA